MKKTALIAVAAIAACIILITQLYEYTDIEIVDTIVESVAKNTGLGKGMVEKKVIEKAKAAEKKQVEIKTELEAPVVKSEVAVNNDSIAKVEEQQKQLALEKEQRKKKLFNVQIDTMAKVTKPKVDSVATAVKPKKKKNLFNASVEDKAKTPASVKKEPLKITALIHGSQKVINDSEVLLRLDKELKTADEVIPANFVFSGKVNMFDNRLNIVVRKIDRTNVNGNVVGKDDGTGISLSELSKAGKYIFLSDGQTVTLSLEN